jgi:transposase
MEVLEPQQQALVLLTGGLGVDEVSDTLNIHRSTLWRWRKQPEFIASWNQMVKQGKEKQVQTLLELQQQAFGVLKDCLSSQIEMLRFKSAMAIVEKVGAMQEGLLYVEEILHKQLQDEKFRQLTDLK